MAASAQDEQKWLDGTHPALQRGGQAALSLDAARDDSDQHTDNVDDDDEDENASSSSRFDARDDDAPPRSSFTPPLNTTRAGTANTGPKGVLADYHARGHTTANTGPKGVLNDWTGNQMASANVAAFAGMRLTNGKPGGLRTVPLEEDDERGSQSNLDEEDWAKTQYRKQRIAQMKGSGERRMARRSRTFGHLREIGIEQFLSAIEEEEQDVAIVMHIYEPEIAACAQLNQHLAAIARGYPRTKFLRALASEVEFATDDEEDTLPTVLVYRGGELETTLVRPDLEWGRGTWSDVVAMLKRHEVISGPPVIPLHSRGQGTSDDSE
ncbi:hypothetical protein OIO90_001731 [Microbotryomycetes sp. JL221]|nr:hypothetical protein OIO90_001731 [Microbotryomycetes sp. JL221]